MKYPPYAKNTKLLVKIHGDLDDANIVIKEDDYLDYPSTHPLIESFIKGVFATKVVLFIGYSFSDIDLKIILQNVRNILGSDFQNAYLLSLDDEFHPSQRQYLRNKGINVIHYKDGTDHVVLNQFQNEINNTYPSYSSKWQKLIAILKFINKFDDFKEQLQGNDPVIQMYKSLNRFTEVRVLPTRFLSNLFPFNNRKGYIHNYHEYVMGSSNTKIVEFFFNDYNAENSTIKNTYYERNKIQHTLDTNYQTYLRSILVKLNHSLVLHFGRTPNKIELFVSPNEFSETVNITLPQKHCKCLSCLYTQLNIKEYLADLRDATVTQTSDLQVDMQIAYSHYKAGNFSIAVRQFEEIANKAWQVEQYITYYIAQQNIKHLRNLLNWNAEEIDRKIIDKIDDIDLDKLLFQIPSLSDDIYKLLKLIRDDDVLKDAERRISEAFEQIRDDYELYKIKKTRYRKLKDLKIISQELNSIFHFYTYNYIIKDEYTNFRDLVEKGVKGLLICYSIFDSKQIKITPLKFSFVQLIVLYMNERTLEATIIKYKLNEILIDPKEATQISNLPNKLFESFISEILTFERVIKLNKEIATQSENYFFTNRLKNILHNTLLIYSIIELPSDYYPKIIRNFLDFFRIENILTLPSENALNRFLKKLLPYFSFEQIYELIQIATTKDFLLGSDNFYESVSESCQKIHQDVFLEKIEIIQDLIAKSIEPKKNKKELSFLFLYKICNQPLRDLISQTVELSLTDKFYLFDYINASFNDVIDPAKFYYKIIQELETSIPKTLKFEQGKPVQEDLTFSNFINLIYAKKLLNNNIPFKNFEAYPDYWKFYFKPFEFDYSKFDPRWLLVIYSKYPLLILKNIPQIKVALEQFISKNHDESLTEIYIRFFIPKSISDI